MSEIIKYLNKEGYSTISDQTMNRVIEWLSWYRSNVKGFHSYRLYNGHNVTKEERYTLGMAKKVCEDWANLIMTENVEINSKRFGKQLEAILKANKFKTQVNKLIELTFALGTGALVEYLDENENVVIDYIRADMIYPLSWDNGTITECAFCSARIVNKEPHIYMQIHRLGKSDGEVKEMYYIENKYIREKDGKEVDLPDGIAPIIDTGSVISLFQILTPNIVNNIELDSPLGISVYANVIPQLKGSDLVYDSYMNEFELGKKRIVVPTSMAKARMKADGVEGMDFDPKEKVFMTLPMDNPEDTTIKEIDMSIRAEEHEKGIQRSLDIISLKTGLGTGRYQFDSTGVKTATEVISDKSDLYQNLKKHENPIGEALVEMVQACAYLSGVDAGEVTVNFDDSIIEDSNATIDKNIKLVEAGLKSKVSAIMEINGMTEKQAEKEMERIAEESQIQGGMIDIFGESEDPSQEEQKENRAKEDNSEGEV